VNLSERIKAAEAALITLKDKLVEDVKLLEASPDDETLLAQVEAGTEQVNKSETSLAALKKAEAALAARATPVAPAIIPKRAEPKQVGDVIFKHAVVAALAYIERKSVDQVIAERYPDAEYVKETLDFVRKSQIDPAMTSVAGWAQELVRNDVQGFIDSLQNVSVAAALSARATSLSFGGFQSITVPRRNHAAGPTEPAWVGEGAPIPLTKFSFGSMTLNRYKLAAITTFTREIAERSTPAIEGLLRSALRDAYADVLDAALLSNGAAVTNLRPAGLLNGVTPSAGVAGGGEDAVRGDIMAMVKAMTVARVGARPVLLVNNIDRLAVSMMTTALSEYVFRDELASGNLLGIPVIASANVPQHTVVLVDAANLVTAFDTPMFDVSEQATVVESSADTTPPTMATDAAGVVGAAGQVPPPGGTPVVGGAAGAGRAGYTARSLWQTWSLGIRMVAPTSWGIMQPGSVQAANTTTWSS
jgi:HK97 family phage major capsid protein